MAKPTALELAMESLEASIMRLESAQEQSSRHWQRAVAEVRKSLKEAMQDLEEIDAEMKDEAARVRPT